VDLNLTNRRDKLEVYKGRDDLEDNLRATSTIWTLAWESAELPSFTSVILSCYLIEVH